MNFFAAPRSSLATTFANTQQQRLKVFVVTLATLDLPLIVIGVLDLPNSPMTLILTLTMLAYYLLYYFLIPTGYGVPATYGCVVLLAALIGVGAHTGTGFLGVLSVLYVLLLVGISMVLNQARALDYTLVLCLLSYGGLIYYELGVAPPEVSGTLYQTSHWLSILTGPLVMIITLVGVWYMMRISLTLMNHTALDLEEARRVAEQRMQEQAVLAEQVQSSNAMLRDTEARLRATVDALSLPLIPLEDGIVLLPLVGFFDEQRADRFVQGLLQAIHIQRISGVVLDITGLQSVNTHVAATLVRTAQAAQLLGSRVLFSGVGANVAHALTQLETKIDALEFAGSLSAALRMLKLPKPQMQ